MPELIGNAELRRLQGSDLQWAIGLGFQLDRHIGFSQVVTVVNSTAVYEQAAPEVNRCCFGQAEIPLFVTDKMHAL
ncbi:hypothetical protein GCM10007094_42980 [Pseudovibrio japonicus]|uniref:Uncharacterized protein n=1 Tax=Pseudovibrio japonicus TaxID=366534 RepID=A0ABQ3ETG7_9HYPH|nr:hypothetical protein GCM10007094_42980 [Pseudovibrio japonicus]